MSLVCYYAKGVGLDALMMYFFLVVRALPFVLALVM